LNAVSLFLMLASAALALTLMRGSSTKPPHHPGSSQRPSPQPSSSAR
jgi:hypothetical protein